MISSAIYQSVRTILVNWVMEKSSLGSRRRDIINVEAAVVADHFSLREWGLKARISRENTLSRRFSASHIRSFQEDNNGAPSFRSNITISSTASSPGYTIREEIDPSKYSFTNALKALQARSINTWECMSPEGFALNSKWNEAERYICNPLSGEVPMECLSAKTLSGRSFRGLPSRVTMSAPLIYPSNHSRLFHSTTSTTTTAKVANTNAPVKAEKKKVGGNTTTRDVGTQSTPPELSSTSSSPSPSSTPPIQERPIKCNLVQSTDSTNSSSKSKFEELEVEVMKEGRQEEGKRELEVGIAQGKKSKSCGFKLRQSSGGGGGGSCFCMKNLWSRRRSQREKHKPICNTDIFICHIRGC